MDFWHSHALISDATRDGLLRACNFSTIGPLRAQVEDGSAKVRLPLNAWLLQTGMLAVLAAPRGTWCMLWLPSGAAAKHVSQIMM